MPDKETKELLEQKKIFSYIYMMK